MFFRYNQMQHMIISPQKQFPSFFPSKKAKKKNKNFNESFHQPMHVTFEHLSNASHAHHFINIDFDTHGFVLRFLCGFKSEFDSVSISVSFEAIKTLHYKSRTTVAAHNALFRILAGMSKLSKKIYDAGMQEMSILYGAEIQNEHNLLLVDCSQAMNCHNKLFPVISSICVGLFLSSSVSRSCNRLFVSVLNTISWLKMSFHSMFVCFLLHSI